MHIVFFGSSLVSAYWNGAATYYRGIISRLHGRGHRVTFYEPDILERQKHRDIADPPYAESIVYSADDQNGVRRALMEARKANIIIKTSGVGIFDALLEEETPDLRHKNNRVVFWDVDAPATLERIQSDPKDPFRPLIPRYDLILTYGGGGPVVKAYSELGAQRCVPLYNALDPETHHPVARDPRFEGTLGFLGNRLPDREARVLEFFHGAAERMPSSRFVLGGSGWEGYAPFLENLVAIGHVYTRDHNAFNVTPKAVLNVLRDGMARVGFSPATRIFETAGAGSCIITDSWRGIELFLEPGSECLVAENGEEVADLLQNLSPERAGAIGQAAMRRVLAQHTYDHRSVQLEAVLRSLL